MINITYGLRCLPVNAMACKHYADAVKLILCVSLVVHLGILHLMAFYQYEIVLDRSQGVDTDGLRCLPVNVMACNTTLMLLGSTYAFRLWCIWVLFTLIAFYETEIICSF